MLQDKFWDQSQYFGSDFLRRLKVIGTIRSQMRKCKNAWYEKELRRQLFLYRGHLPYTLGARDFSSAVSGFGQVFSRLRRSCIRPSAEDVLACGRHPAKVPPHTREKTSDTQGIYLKAIFTIFRKAFAPPWKPYRIGPLFTHKNCVLGAVSVTAQSCAATISKVLCHSIYWRGFVPYFAAAWKSITTVAEVDKQERELESSAPNLLGQTRRRDVWCERTCAVSGSFPCRHENLSDTVWT